MYNIILSLKWYNSFIILRDASQKTNCFDQVCQNNNVVIQNFELRIWFKCDMLNNNNSSKWSIDIQCGIKIII